MQFQTASTINMAEVVFRAVRSGITATATSTDRLGAGEPVVLQTHTASANGQYVIRALTATDPINNLYVGNVHATIEHDAVGLVQVYGVDDDCKLAATGSVTFAPGTLLRPSDFRGMVTVAPLYGTAAAAGSAHAEIAGIEGLAVVLHNATAASTESALISMRAFIRAL